MWDKKINEAMSIADSVTAVATDIGNDLIDDMNNTIEGKYFDGGVERNGSFFYNKNGLKVAGELPPPTVVGRGFLFPRPRLLPA